MLGTKLRKKQLLIVFVKVVSATLTVKRRIKLLEKSYPLWITGKMLDMTQAFVTKSL